MPLRIATKVALTPLVLPPRVPIIVPYDEDAMEDLRPFVGEKLRTTTLPTTRVDQLRRWYFGLVQLVADGHGILKESLHAQLKLRVGFILSWEPHNGQFVPILGSVRHGIKLVDMRRYVDKAIDCIFTDFLPGVKRSDVLNEVERRYGARPD